MLLPNPISAVIFRYCVSKAVSATEFYPNPYYETVYLENQSFSVEAKDQTKADELAYAFLANLQKEHDNAYFALLDDAGVKYRKRQEIEERRPIYLRELRRSDAKSDKPYSEKGAKVLNEYRLNDYYRETELPQNPQVQNYIFERNPDNKHYHFFRLLTNHQTAFGIAFLAIVVLLILFVPGFREMAILDKLNLE